MVEKDPAHIECIKENCRRVAAAGSESKLLILNFDATDFHRYWRQLPDKPDIIFGDPPYDISAEIFHKLLNNQQFTDFNSGAQLVWEIPDTPGAMGEFIGAENLNSLQFRRFGGTIFLTGNVK